MNWPRQNPFSSRNLLGSRGGMAKPKGNAYHCKKPRHHNWKCRDYLAKMNNKGSSCLNVVETYLLVVST